MQAQEQNDSAFGALSRLWKRRKWQALAVFVVAFVATASFVASLPDIYSSTATVMVNQQLPQGDSGGGPGGQGQDSRLDAVSEEVLSRDRLLALIDRFNLYPEVRKSASEDALLTRMRQDIQLERKSGPQQWGQDPTFAFTLSYQGWSPKLVAQVTNALADSYVDQNNRMRSQLATTTLATLQSQLTDIKHKLDTQSQRINAFRAAHVGELPEQQATSLAMLQQLDGQLHENAQSLGQTLQQRQSAATQKYSGGQSDDVSDLPALEDQLAALRSRYTDQYPDVVRLKQQIAALKKLQDDRSASGPDTPDQDANPDNTIKSYQDEDSRLRTEIAGYQARLENMPVREQQLQSLMQGYAETQDVYSQLLKRYEETPLPQSPNGQYRVLERAVSPTDPSGPNRLRLLLLCLVASLGLAAGLVFMLEQMDPTFHSVDELRAFSRVPVLANIPQIITRQDVWRSRLRFGTAAISVLVLTLVVAQGASLMGHGNTGLVWMLSKHGAPGATSNSAG